MTDHLAGFEVVSVGELLEGAYICGIEELERVNGVGEDDDSCTVLPPVVSRLLDISQTEQVVGRLHLHGDALSTTLWPAIAHSTLPDSRWIRKSTYHPPTESEAVSVVSYAGSGGHLNDTRVEIFAVLTAIVQGR